MDVSEGPRLSLRRCKLDGSRSGAWSRGSPAVLDDETIATARLKAAKARAARERAREKARTPEARAKAKEYRERAKAAKAAAASTPKAIAAARALQREEFIQNKLDWRLYFAASKWIDKRDLPHYVEGAPIWVCYVGFSRDATAYTYQAILGWECSIIPFKGDTVFSSDYYGDADQAKGWVYDMVYGNGSSRGLQFTWLELSGG